MSRTDWKARRHARVSLHVSTEHRCDDGCKSFTDERKHARTFSVLKPCNGVVTWPDKINALIRIIWTEPANITEVICHSSCGVEGVFVGVCIPRRNIQPVWWLHWHRRSTKTHCRTLPVHHVQKSIRSHVVQVTCLLCISGLLDSKKRHREHGKSFGFVLRGTHCMISGVSNLLFLIYYTAMGHNLTADHKNGIRHASSKVFWITLNVSCKTKQNRKKKYVWSGGIRRS